MRNTLRSYRNFIISSIAAAIIGAWTLGGYEYVKLQYFLWQHDKAYKAAVYSYENDAFDSNGLAIAPGYIEFSNNCLDMYLNKRHFEDYTIGKNSALIRDIRDQMNSDNDNTRCGSVNVHTKVDGRMLYWIK